MTVHLPAVRPLAADILKVSSAALGGPYNALLRSPEMARRCIDLLDYLRFKTSVDKRLNEFAILIQARIANAQYERWAHETIARRAGLSGAVMADLRECRRPAAMRDDERLVHDHCVQLSLNHRVPDALWQQAVSTMAEKAVIDLTVHSGTCVMVSMLLNATQVGIPNGGTPPPAGLSARVARFACPLETPLKTWFARPLLSFALAAAACAAAAQDFPSRPLTMVMPYAAGGPGDTITRVFSEAVQKALGQQRLVENIAGTIGTIGTTKVARAKPDGYTLLMIHVSHATNLTMYKGLP